MAETVAVDVVSDVVCPWCFVGTRRLQLARDEMQDLAVNVSYRPFQLDPTIPPQGMDREAYMLGKFGDPARIASAHAKLDELGAEVGINFNFAAIKVSPNTLDAHRVIRWAANSGHQPAVVAELFSRYFERGQDIGDHKVLCEAAESAGMDVAIVRSLLATDADKAQVRAEIETAGRMGITGVPCFIIASKFAVMGAQSVETLADAIRQGAAEAA